MTEKISASARKTGKPVAARASTTGKVTVTGKPASRTAVASKATAPKKGIAKAVVKPAKSVKPVKAVKAVKEPARLAKEAKPVDAKDKHKKAKLVRDSFTMPEPEYEVLAIVKKACIKAGLPVKKSELLRIGVALVRDKTPAELQAVLSTLIPLKAGRPKKIR